MDEEEYEEDTEELFTSRERGQLSRFREAVTETQKAYTDLTDLIKIGGTGLPAISDQGRMWYNEDSYSSNDADRELVSPELLTALKKFVTCLDAVHSGELDKQKKEEASGKGLLQQQIEAQFYTPRAATPPRSRPNKATSRGTKFRPFD
jgi:hypothetical protein